MLLHNHFIPATLRDQLVIPMTADHQNTRLNFILHPFAFIPATLRDQLVIPMTADHQNTRLNFILHPFAFILLFVFHKKI